MMDLQAKLQQGSALIISLLILLVLTIIGVTALNSTVMEEKMSSNFQTGNNANQAADSAVNQIYANIANDYTLVAQAITAQATTNPDVSTPTVAISGSPGLDPNANNQITLNATVSYHGPGLGENCSIRLCSAEVVRVTGSGTVNNTTVTRNHAMGVKKNRPAPPQ